MNSKQPDTVKKAEVSAEGGWGMVTISGQQNPRYPLRRPTGAGLKNTPKMLGMGCFLLVPPLQWCNSAGDGGGKAAELKDTTTG